MTNALFKIPKVYLISGCGSFVERHSFDTRKAGEISVFYAVIETVPQHYFHNKKDQLSCLLLVWVFVPQEESL